MHSAGLPRPPVNRWLGLCALTLFALAVPVLFPPRGQASDTVAALRRYLSVSQYDATELKERERQLKQYVAALKGIAELREALELPYWQDLVGRNLGPRAVDQAARAEVGRRLTQALTEAARKGDVTRRLAVAHAIGAMGNDIRALSAPVNAKGNTAGRPLRSYASSLAPLLIQLCQDRAPAVRQAAARALGRTNPDAPTATAALQALLGKDEVATRRAAAEALCGLVELPTPHVVEGGPGGAFKKGVFGKGGFGKGPGGGKGGRSGSRQVMIGRLTQTQILEASKDVIPVAAAGLADSDAAVRGLCLEAIRRTAVTLRDEIFTAYFAGGYSTHAGAALTALQQRRLETLRQAMAAREEKLRPMFGAFYEHGAALRRALRSQDAATNLKSAEVLQILAEARAQLLRGTDLAIPGARKVQTDPLGAVVLFAVPDLAAKLTHADVKTRTACVGALEALGIDAAPAVDALVMALKDKEGTVRAGAVQTLAGIGPEPLSEALAAKVAVGLAGCAGDAAETVRKRALSALWRYRSAAAPAVEPLTRALAKADAGTQLLILQVLEAIGANAKAAVPALSAVLSANEPQVRAAAARALGRFGRAAAPATKALVAVLDDANVAVRQAASEALLAIGEAGK